MIRLFDAHADTPYELWRRKETMKRNNCHIDLEKSSVFSHYRQVFAFCSLAGTKWELCENDFQKCLQNFRNEISQQTTIVPFLSIEGPEVIACDARRLAEHNICMSTLTWNADNVLAGCHMGNQGLTHEGRTYVEIAQELGVVMDVSHLSETAFWDLVRITKEPICASHSNCRSLFDHSRNLTDDQLRAISDTDGVVGLNLYRGFLGENANFDTLREHLEHMLELCGEAQVCLGGDLDGCDLLVHGFQNVSNYVDFYQYLTNCGYDENLLDKIFYSNLLRLF